VERGKGKLNRVLSSISFRNLSNVENVQTGFDSESPKNPKQKQKPIKYVCFVHHHGVMAN